jgi:hypothetical protein
MTKRLLLFLTAALLFTTTFALADEITFSMVGLGTGTDITAIPSGMIAGPGNVFEVTDVTTGIHFPLTDVFNAMAGPSHSITVGPTTYTAFFSSGPAGSVSITNALSGNMLDDSEITAVFPGSQGSFSGEFEVSSFNPEILKMFGIHGKVAPVGSVGITFANSHVDGVSLTGDIGGGSTTVLTIKTVVPEPNTLIMFVFGIGMLAAVYYARKASQE